MKVSKNRFAALTDFASSDSDEVETTTETIKTLENAPHINNKSKKKLRRNKNKRTNFIQTEQNPFSKNNSIQKQTHLPPKNWQQKDAELVKQMFHDDMLKAIELSKQEHEKNLHEKAIENKMNDKDAKKSTSASQLKQKSTKMFTLDKFHEHVDNLSIAEDIPNKKKNQPFPTVKKDFDGAGDYFTSIDRTVAKIEGKEHKQKSSNAVSNSLSEQNNIVSDLLTLATVFNGVEATSSQSNDNQQKINELEEEVEMWKTKCEQTKKRNRQLLIMLQQGEMKDKADLLLEVERLSSMRDELTQEIAFLNENLQKERTKVTKLKDELKIATTKRKT